MPGHQHLSVGRDENRRAQEEAPAGTVRTRPRRLYRSQSGGKSQRSVGGAQCAASGLASGGDRIRRSEEFQGVRSGVPVALRFSAFGCGHCGQEERHAGPAGRVVLGQRPCRPPPWRPGPRWPGRARTRAGPAPQVSGRSDRRCGVGRPLRCQGRGRARRPCPPGTPPTPSVPAGSTCVRCRAGCRRRVRGARRGPRPNTARRRGRR